MKARQYLNFSPSRPDVRYYNTNVGNENEFAAIATQIRADIGNPTIVLNNAGVTIGRKILDTPAGAMLRLMEVNTFSHMYAAKIFLPHMVETNHGHIVTVASSASYVRLLLQRRGANAYNIFIIRCPCRINPKVATKLGVTLADHPNQFITPTLLPETVARRVVRSIACHERGANLVEKIRRNCLCFLRCTFSKPATHRATLIHLLQCVD